MTKSLKTATILSGQSLSDAIELHGNTVTAIQWPATWTSDPPTVTCQASLDGGVSYAEVADDKGGILLLIANQGTITSVNPYLFIGFTHLKFRSGQAGDPSVQGADRTIKIQTEPIF